MKQHRTLDFGGALTCTTLYFIIRSETPGRFIHFGWIGRKNFYPRLVLSFQNLQNEASQGGWVFYLKCLSCTSFPQHLLRKISFQLKKMFPYIIYTLYASSSRVRNCRTNFLQNQFKFSFLQQSNESNNIDLIQGWVVSSESLVVEAKVC